MSQSKPAQQGSNQPSTPQQQGQGSSQPSTPQQGGQATIRDWAAF